MNGHTVRGKGDGSILTESLGLGYRSAWGRTKLSVGYLIRKVQKTG